MIVEFVEFRHRPGQTREEILEEARATVPKWQGNSELIRKHYVTGENGMGGAFYLWPSREAAERFAGGRRTVLFVDEVHRFNKAQQDAFLPHIERGSIVFVGATTENPSFELNSALLSRCRVHVMEAVSPADIEQALRRALDDDERGLGGRGLVVAEPQLRLVAAEKA